MDARIFFDAWKTAVTEHEALLKENWRKNANFTHQIIGCENSILHNIAQKLNIKCYEKDYYYLDAVFYRTENLVPGLNEGNYWFRDIEIAFEHENHFNSGLYKEVSHLLLVNSKLKVLVTYPNGDAVEAKELDRIFFIIDGSNYASEISEKKMFILIFGYENDFSWKGFIFNREQRWIKIE